MIKIIPIALIPLFFFTLYFNVIFLTESNLPEIENLVVENKSEQKLIIDKNVNTSLILDEKKNQVEINKNNNMRSDIQLEQYETTDVNKKANNNNFTKNSMKTKQSEIVKLIKVQFGAFKSEKNVANLESKLNKLLKKQFGDNFGSFSVLKEKKHLKLILNTNSVMDAKEICNYSKKNNINCLIIN